MEQWFGRIHFREKEITIFNLNLSLISSLTDLED